MTFWPKINISDAHTMSLLHAQGWVLKGHGISIFDHGKVKVMEKSWNLKVQKEHKPC